MSILSMLFGSTLSNSNWFTACHHKILRSILPSFPKVGSSANVFFVPTLVADLTPGGASFEELLAVRVGLFPQEGSQVVFGDKAILVRIQVVELLPQLSNGARVVAL